MNNHILRQNIPIPMSSGMNMRIPGKIVVPKPETNDATFYKTNHYIDKMKTRMLHVIPTYRGTPKKIQYEIFGTDGLRIENTMTFNFLSQFTKPIISFVSNNGETYFLKIIAFYLNGNVGNENNYTSQEFFLFYKMEDDFNESDSKPSEEEIEVRKKVNEDEEEDEEEDAESESTNIPDIDENEIENIFADQEIMTRDELKSIREFLTDKKHEKSKKSGLNFSGDDDSPFSNFEM